MVVNASMNRRTFLKSGLLLSMKAALLVPTYSLLKSGSAMASTNEENMMVEADSLSLREIALKKMHHGKNHFINPFSRREHGNLWKVLNWKLFSKNHFKKYYKQEKVLPRDWFYKPETAEMMITR